MFGLMKTKICSGTASDGEARRLAYCGTCKTLGARYGQRTRLFLDHDTVFLAELLEALPGPPEAGPVDRAFRSYSCLSLPSYGPAVPVRLRYAAAVNVFLAESKLADRGEDSPSRLLDAAARAYAGAFERAGADLEAWGAPVDEIRSALRSQSVREAAASAAPGAIPAAAVLRDLAMPTSRATGLFFEHGARAAGRPDATGAMASLGTAFGTLIYLLDAFEDYDRDASRAEFNAFRAAYALPDGPLPEAQLPPLRQAVWSAGVEAADRIEGLPIPAGQKDRFVRRLRSNLSARLGEVAGAAAHVCATPAVDGDEGNGRRALGRARAIASASLRSASPWRRAVLAPLLAVLALPLALFLPVWARPERSFRESLGLLLNLMFAGAVVRALVSPMRFSAAGPGDPGGVAGEAVKHHAKKGSGGGGGDGGCCDGCDCGDCCGGCDC